MFCKRYSVLTYYTQICIRIDLLRDFSCLVIVLLYKKNIHMPRIDAHLVALATGRKKRLGQILNKTWLT